MTINNPEKRGLKKFLDVSDKVFTAIFVIEMLMKWIGMGLKKYFTNGWCLLDFVIVVVSLNTFNFIRNLKYLKKNKPILSFAY